jgi:hypothetical protein
VLWGVARGEMAYVAADRVLAADSSGGYHGDDGEGNGGSFRLATPRAPGMHLLPPAQRAKVEQLCR